MFLRRINAGLSQVCLFLAALGAAVMAILISYVVAQRFIWHQSPHWAEELPGSCWCGLLFWGESYVPTVKAICLRDCCQALCPRANCSALSGV